MAPRLLFAALALALPGWRILLTAEDPAIVDLIDNRAPVFPGPAVAGVSHPGWQTHWATDPKARLSREAGDNGPLRYEITGDGRLICPLVHLPMADTKLVGRLKITGHINRIAFGLLAQLPGKSEKRWTLIHGWNENEVTAEAWQAFEAPLQALPGAVSGDLELAVTGDGVAWIDDLHVRELDPAQVIAPRDFDGTFARWDGDRHPLPWVVAGDPAVSWQREATVIGTRPAALRVTAPAGSVGEVTQAPASLCPPDPRILLKVRTVDGQPVPTLSVRLRHGDDPAVERPVDLVDATADCWWVASVTTAVVAGGHGTRLSLVVCGPGTLLIDDVQLIAATPSVHRVPAWQASATPPSLPTGPILEDGSCDAVTAAAGWVLEDASAGSLTVARDPTVFHSAPAALCLTSGNSPGEGGMVHPLPALPAGTYHLSGMIRLDGTVRSTEIAVLGEDRDGAWPWLHLAGFTSQQAGPDWVPFDAPMTLAKDMKQLRLVVRFAGTGSLRLDDLRMEPLAP